MSGTNSADRLERVLERLRESATGPAPAPRGGFEDVERRGRRRRQAAALRVAALAVVVAAAGGVSWWLLRGDPTRDAGRTPPIAVVPPAPTSVPSPSPAAPQQPLPERTVVYVAESGAVLREVGPRLFALDEGTVWFSVEPGSGRVEVRTPDRVVVVLGTVFAVQVEQGSSGACTTVGVLTGHVRVEPAATAPAGTRPIELSAGEELASGAGLPKPLAAPWRTRMAELFPERVAFEARAASPSVPVPPVPVLPAEPVPPAAPIPPEVAAQADGHDVASPTLPIPPPAPTWSQRYEAAEARLRSGDAAGAATELEALSESAPSPAAAEVTLLDLGRVYRQNLRDFGRAQAVYQRYLDRFPQGRLREDARLALCSILDARGDAAGERDCLQAYLLEFPDGSAADTVRRRLATP